MAAPNPSLRISPSGPLAGGNTPPLSEYAGAEFLADQEVVAPGTLAYLTARIGPSDVTNAPTAFLKRGGTAPQSGTIADQLESNMIPMGVAASEQAASDALGMSAGLWLVEAVISMGFNTSLPAANEHGGLRANFEVVSDDSSVLKSVAAIGLDNTPRAVGAAPVILTAAQVGIVHSTVFRQIVPISQAEVDANNSVVPEGTPFRGLQCRLQRVAGSSAYTANSGWLEFTRNCRLSFRRFR